LSSNVAQLTLNLWSMKLLMTRVMTENSHTIRNLTFTWDLSVLHLHKFHKYFFSSSNSFWKVSLEDKWNLIWYFFFTKKVRNWNSCKTKVHFLWIGPFRMFFLREKKSNNKQLQCVIRNANHYSVQWHTIHRVLLLPKPEITQHNLFAYKKI
jgi:hypothetical protein